jgi:hypothetical protein
MSKDITLSNEAVAQPQQKVLGLLGICLGTGMYGTQQ